MLTVIRKTCERISDSEGQVTDLGLLCDPLGKGLSPHREGGLLYNPSSSSKLEMLMYVSPPALG